MIKQDLFNAADYAYVETSSQDIIFRWEEMRDIFAIIVYCDDPNLLSDAVIQYWQRVWPHHRVPKGAIVGAGGSGWMPDDDWFSGSWKSADINLKLENDRAIYTFNPINSKEFPDIKDFNVNYRRTLKIRILFGRNKPEIKYCKVLTDSIWKEISVKVEWGDLFNESQGEISFFYGSLLSIERLTDNIKLDNDNKWISNGKNGSLKLNIKYAYNEDVNSYDKTIVTIRTKNKSFSFLIDDLISGEKIFIKDYDVLITQAGENINYCDFKKEWELNHSKTLYDRIKDLPEQTYERAWNDMPKKKSRGFMPMGCEGGRQKFAVDQNGDVFFSKNYVTKIRGKDTDRVLWEGTWIRYSFGFPNTQPIERYRLDGYLPMIYGKWASDGIIYEQSAFVTLLGKSLVCGERMQGDDPTVLLAKVILTNTTDSQDVTLKLKSKCDIEETLSAQDGFVFADNYEPKRLRYYLDTMGKGSLKNNSEGLFYTVHLNKDESHSIYLKIPFITLADDDEFETLKKTDYESEFPKVKEFWRQRVCEGTQIETPNKILNNFYKAHLTHMLITDDREVGSDRYASRVGTFVYGVFPDESIMCISDLDRHGYKKEAEERLELLIHYQSTVGVPGTYSTIEGQYYGAGGYECGGYNKSHGWVLWGLGEHYWYHRDKEWLNRVAPSIVKACDWINKERESTKKFDANGKKVIEYGFLPAGSLEDVTDFWHWLATNAPTYWGFKNVAKALIDIGHPEGERLLKDAEEYGKDLMAGFRESMIISPVVKLRDGTFVPHFPPRLYLRGRGFGWIRETLEGAIHLIRSEILDPCSDEATWIMKDYEDNLYISERYGYSVDDFERDWFSLGGFSMQSNLLCHTIPYLWRDEPKHFLRGYFNAFTSAFYPDICACVEHALPTLADNNGVWFKPSDEAQSTFWLRLMFIYERDNELNLGMCIPREWLEHGKLVEIKRAVTYFGEMDYKIHSLSNDGVIKMTLNPPKRNVPEKINVRFRHPNEKPIKKVLVNGKEWGNFSVEKEMITLSRTTDTTEIIAMY
ncbi:MAG: hypothetical protein ACUVWN_05295 [bacterium]